MKQLTLLLVLLVSMFSAYGQKKTTDKSRFSLKADTSNFGKKMPINNSNLVSYSSFKRIFKRDFASVVGTNNLPTNQLIVGLNKPEILFGKLFQIYKDPSKSMPILGLYPFLGGKLNNDDEFRLGINNTNSIHLKYGGKVVFFPLGLAKKTRYFFNLSDSKTKLFIDKNQLIKQKLISDYDKTTFEAKKKKLSDEEKQIEEEITQKTENAKTIKYLLGLKSTLNIKVDDTNKLTISQEGGVNSIVFEKDEIESAIQNIRKNNGFIRTVGVKNKNVFILTNEKDTINISPVDILKSLDISDDDISNLKDKKNKIIAKKIEVEELDASSEKDLKKMLEDKIFEAEKDAPWTKRHFLWFTLDYDNIPQSVNLFRNNSIEKDQIYRNGSLGISINYSYFKKKLGFNGFAKFEKYNNNSFLTDYDAITILKDSILTGTQYKIAESTEVYDVRKLTTSQLVEKSNRNLLTLGMTILKSFGDIDKKYGVTTEYKSDLDKKIANLKIGLIFPVILDNSKAEQSNLIFELVLPDVHSKSIGNDESAFKRSYINLKLGIPINFL